MLVHSPFPRFKTFLEAIFWDLFELRRRSQFDGIDVRKMGSLQNRFDFRKDKKVRLGKIGGIWGVFQSCIVSFFEKLPNTQGCKQERYRDGAPMRGLPKDSASCHTLILRGAEESLYRPFGSLFGLGVGIRSEKRSRTKDVLREITFIV